MRRRRRTQETEQAGGGDAFLDVVANLVGILVILVMVIGVRAQGAYVSADQPVAEVPAEQVVARERLRNESTRLETNANELQSQVDELNAIVKTRQVERQQLQVLLATARRELDERRQGLSEEEQQQVAAAAQSRELLAELEQLEAQRETLEADGARPIALEHLPTPLAKTVFGHEEHFRLKGGRLVYVPLNELTDLPFVEHEHVDRRSVADQTRGAFVGGDHRPPLRMAAGRTVIGPATSRRTIGPAAVGVRRGTGVCRPRL